MLISHASGFLVFGGGLPVQFHMTGQAYLLAAATALLCVIAGLLPALDFARRSLIAYKAERARGSRRPLWQRLYLDLVVLTGALYGLAVLNKQGPVTTGAATATVAQDPLIALAPVLFAVAITLLISRLLPWMAGALVGMLAGISSPAIHVALQSVARAPRQPMRLVQLCTMTLTLGIFAATVAGVEARNQLDQQAYEAGAMVRLQEAVNRTQGAGKGIPDAMPLADHLQLPGVRAVMPAMRYPSIGNITNTTSGGASIDVLGIDPHTASQVIWFRADFANLSLNRLLSLIVRPSPDTIVSETFLKATGLRQGDSFDVTLTNERTITLRVAGVVGYFPTLNPEAFPFVITNLEYLQRTSHGYGPNEMWLAVDPDSRRIDRLLEEVLSLIHI